MGCTGCESSGNSRAITGQPDKPPVKVPEKTKNENPLVRPFKKKFKK